MIGHEEAWALLPEAATDTLGDSAALQLSAHLDGCARCTAELASLRAVAALLMYATPLEPVSTEARARLRRRLEARARADSAANDVRHPGQRARAVSDPPGRRSHVRIAALAASIALVASLAATGWALRDRASLRARLSSRDDAAMAEQRVATRKVDSLERLVATITAPSVTAIRLTASGTRPTDAAIYWNRKARRLAFIAHTLPRVMSGRSYELWVLTDTAPVPAGMVTPDDRGDVALSVDSIAVGSEVRGFAVTEEPANGSSQPTTQPLLSGRVPANG